MWEEANDIKINVFVLDEDDNIKIEYHSSLKTKNVCNMLLYKEHYVWIKNLDLMLQTQVSILYKDVVYV